MAKLDMPRMVLLSPHIALLYHRKAVLCLRTEMLRLGQFGAIHVTLQAGDSPRSR